MLFEVSNVSSDIKQNIEMFLNFCRKNKMFSTRLFTIALNSSYEVLEKEEVKKVAQYCIDILTNDEDALTNFLFDRKKEGASSREASDEVEEEPASTIESEAERLFNDSPIKSEEAQWEKKQDEFEKFELISLTLAHLKEAHKN